jgi:hypothetical protein
LSGPTLTALEVCQGTITSARQPELPHAIPNTILQLIDILQLIECCLLPRLLCALATRHRWSSWVIVAHAAIGIKCPGSDK